MTTKYTSLTDEQKKELFTLAPSTWTDRSPMYHHDYARTADMTKVAKNLLAYVWYGTCDDEQQAERIMATMQDAEDRKTLAIELICMDNYTEFAPDYNHLGQDEELEATLRTNMAAYKGLDAYLEAAQLEFAENLAQDFADVEDLIALFK